MLIPWVPILEMKPNTLLNKLNRIKRPMWTERLQYQKNKEQMHFFSSSASTSDEIDLLLMEKKQKTTTTIRITIHNKCNKYDKLEMNREVNRISY